ncbi:hypothetical protein SAMN05518849_11666 [Sphingobium sp. AP50]|uniref:hypothetical protein n=1 Tax=Sphingobium sp. AP50 TaxID=1884369 RepID=UPI0008D31D7C|nr:hypothetical protein [Sphingobium sp. AP50]SEJ87262.1 hypothetical protein SAMN05518849_11666 [Sphingobium sp. AP50]
MTFLTLIGHTVEAAKSIATSPDFEAACGALSVYRDTNPSEIGATFRAIIVDPAGTIVARIMGGAGDDAIRTLAEAWGVHRRKLAVSVMVSAVDPDVEGDVGVAITMTQLAADVEDLPDGAGEDPVDQPQLEEEIQPDPVEPDQSTE